VENHVIYGGGRVRKIDKEIADRYFREKNRYIIIYFIVWFIVSYGVVLFAEPLSKFTINGFPFHYFMGAQGAVITFIILLFINAKVGDHIDKKYGIDEKKNEQISTGKAFDH
jgi:putative solute:sodium symporter small subunit